MRAVVALIILLGVFFSAPWWMPRTWYRSLLYPDRRPNALSRVLNRANAWFSAGGFGPKFLVTLETKGRRTGKSLRNPMVVVEVGGERYLVSMLGERADWVLNARAAGGQATLYHRSPEPVLLEQVPASARAPVLKAYLRRAPGGRPHFDIGPDASIEQFAQIASSYPVFRIQPQ